MNDGEKLRRIGKENVRERERQGQRVRDTDRDLKQNVQRNQGECVSWSMHERRQGANVAMTHRRFGHE